MISPRATNQGQALEPANGRPEVSGEQWLGRSGNSSEAPGRRLWERLNPRHRKTLLLLARALVLRQAQARLPEPLRARLVTALEELERLAARIEKLLATLASHHE